MVKKDTALMIVLSPFLVFLSPLCYSEYVPDIHVRSIRISHQSISSNVLVEVV